jgi:hypothetical protein
LGIVAVIAVAKLIYPKYFSNLFSLYFQTSYGQKQVIEQLSGNTITSLILNIVFITTLSTYVSLIFAYKGLIEFDLWLNLQYSFSALSCIYLFKYVFLSFLGWIFNEEETVSYYIFVVFITNKILALLLIPFVFLLAFGNPELIAQSIIVSFFLLGCIFIYRYILSISSLRRNIKVNAFHFFIYLLAVEVLPLFIIYKAVFQFINTTPIN